MTCDRNLTTCSCYSYDFQFVGRSHRQHILRLLQFLGFNIALEYDFALLVIFIFEASVKSIRNGATNLCQSLMQQFSSLLVSINMSLIAYPRQIPSWLFYLYVQLQLASDYNMNPCSAQQDSLTKLVCASIKLYTQRSTSSYGN